MKKRIMAIICAALMLLMCSCSKTDTSQTKYANKTLAGRVVSIEDDELTLLLGEMSAGSGDSDDSQRPQPPSGDDANYSDNKNDGQPPEKPDASGDDQQNDAATSDTQSANQPPEKPDSSDNTADGANSTDNTSEDNAQQAGGNGGNGAPPDMPQNGVQSFTATGEVVNLKVADDAKDSMEDIKADDIVNVETDENAQVISIEEAQTGMGGQPGQGGFGGSGEVTQGDAANTIDEDGTYSDETYTSTGDDENALRIDGAKVTLSGITVDKSAGATSNTENGDFYGMNAALLATNGANVTIKNAKVTSSAQNGNGVFSYGEGTIVNISDSTITTTADNSGGIQTTGGGTTNASNLTVETSGNSSAAIRSDRGGGTVDVDGGTYTSNGYNSPAVYSTADITVKNAKLTANSSEALVIEGKNSIALENCDVCGNMSKDKGTSSDENVHNVMIYQSMSGDADVGTSAFSMTGGTLTGNSGDMFYVTNTHCVMTLSGVKIVNKDADGYLMRIVGNSASHGWGSAGANGAQVELTAKDQTLEGDIVVDTISTLDMTLSGASTFTGAINIIDNEQNGTAVDGNANITIEKGCTWKLTGNCTVSTLTNNGTIDFNGYTITLADGTVLGK